ncbi:MAG TPA: ABC transporter ATP-binding protein [bacterium]|nr:ABC transporter ATP-binding protein [bacterium]
MTDALVDARALRKDYGQQPVLRGIDLRIATGELLGLIGPNGAGKSTLLRCLIGLVQPSAGQLSLFGLDPRDAALAIRRHTSYLPGETGVYRHLTGRQFLEFALGFYPGRNRDLERRLLEEFQLPLRDRVRNYSAGMKQKLALVATLVPDVELYLLDEPDRMLDASVRFFLRGVLRELRAADKTILLSSHHLSEVETLADRLSFLLDGRLVPEAHVAAARARLRRRPRIRLKPGRELPPGGHIVRTESDGVLVVETDGDPMRWLQSASGDAIASVEIGVERLEDLYQLLLAGGDGAAP